MTEQLRALVVDDEEGVRFFLEETLRMSGHGVTTAATGQEALDRLREERFDLIMLDLRLGGRVDGLKVLEAVRWRWPETIVIILTAHGSLETAMAAIREGVDGYLLKPVEPKDVRNAIREALGRREKLTPLHAENADETVLEVGPFFVDLSKHQVAVHGQLVDLTTQEFSLLVHLMQNAERVVSPVELVEVVRQYRPEYMHEAREIIKWYIYRLRQKVEVDASNPRYVLNVRGVGYTFGA
jgi:DNA-binding response OmpR family regulator